MIDSSDRGGEALSDAGYRAVVERARDLILRATPAGEILYASPIAQTLLGRSGPELVGRDICDLSAS